jgi:DNA-binding beta-propeller fold protein YncE
MTAHRKARTVLAWTGLVIGAAPLVLLGLLTPPHRPLRHPLPLRQVSELTLPGDGSRFDYASLDPRRGLLFIAHLGTGQVIEIDIHAGRVLRVIPGLPDVHGVLVVPELHRVYATATGTNTMATIDEDTGRILTRTPTGAYPDGLAYDPVHKMVWVTNETGGSETVIDATTGTLRGTVHLGGEAGNVAYDPATRQILVDIQTRDTLAVITPSTLTVTGRIHLRGCHHDHGLTLDAADRLALVACDGNDRLLTLDLTTWRITGTDIVGSDPDVLAYDPAQHRLYVAAESGWITTGDIRSRHLTVTGRAHLADGAHVVAVDPITHRSYYPIPHGATGHPALMTYEPLR